MEEKDFISPFVEFTDEDGMQTVDEVQKFVKAYTKKDDSVTDEDWLKSTLKEELPEKSEEEIEIAVTSIIAGVNEFDKNYAELNEHCAKGGSSETWVADKISDAATTLSINDYGNYLNSINNTIEDANMQMLRTVTTNNCEISQCLNLDGFIAEQKAVNSFNLNAKLEGSNFYAQVEVPAPGQTYGRNSVDIVIKDGATDKIIHKYQAKFGKDADTTITMLKRGNYNNQRFLVPEDQVDAVREAFPTKTVEGYIGGTDKVKTKSNPFNKSDVKEAQLEAQEQNIIPAENWNSFNTKQLAINIGKESGKYALYSAAITTGVEIAHKKMNGEKIDSDELIEIALTTGADTGIKVAASGAIYVAVEKGIVKVIPKGTAPGVIANVVAVGIENAKIATKIASGEIPSNVGLDLMGRTTCAMVGGIVASSLGVVGGTYAACMIMPAAFLGGTTAAVTAGTGLGLATTLGIAGIAGVAGLALIGAGALVGGTVAYMAGSKIGNAVYSGVKKVASGAKNIACKIGSGIKSAGKKVWSAGKSIASKTVGKLFGRRW